MRRIADKTHSRSPHPCGLPERPRRSLLPPGEGAPQERMRGFQVVGLLGFATRKPTTENAAALSSSGHGNLNKPPRLPARCCCGYRSRPVVCESLGTLAAGRYFLCVCKESNQRKHTLVRAPSQRGPGTSKAQAKTESKAPKKSPRPLRERVPRRGGRGVLSVTNGNNDSVSREPAVSLSHLPPLFSLSGGFLGRGDCGCRVPLLVHLSRG